MGKATRTTSAPAARNDVATPETFAFAVSALTDGKLLSDKARAKAGTGRKAMIAALCVPGVLTSMITAVVRDKSGVINDHVELPLLAAFTDARLADGVAGVGKRRSAVKERILGSVFGVAKKAPAAGGVWTAFNRTLPAAFLLGQEGLQVERKGPDTDPVFVIAPTADGAGKASAERMADLQAALDKGADTLVKLLTAKPGDGDEGEGEADQSADASAALYSAADAIQREVWNWLNPDGEANVAPPEPGSTLWKKWETLAQDLRNFLDAYGEEA